MQNLNWGHALVNPDGIELRVPASVFPRLDQMGLLVRGRIPRISPEIYQYMHPEYDPLTAGLRYVLGPDMSGPAWCECNCSTCQRRQSDRDHTSRPRDLVPSPCHALAPA